MDMSKRVVELEGASSSVPMVPKSELEALKGEVRLLKEEKAILESKVDGNFHLDEKMLLLQGKVASLELE